MHKHKRFRHRHHHWNPFGGFFWLFLLAFFFMGEGRWWPGLLVVIGLCMVFGSLFRDEAPRPPRDLPPVQMPVAPPAPAVPTMTVSAASAAPSYRADLLPANCSQCGGPVRSQEVRWTGKQSAACAYCGSALVMKKG